MFSDKNAVLASENASVAASRAMAYHEQKNDEPMLWLFCLVRSGIAVT
jgi:hypothetical protein